MKTCGACNLCCKVLQVESLAKPAGRLCEHAMGGRGCAIHGRHPADCQAFACGWLQWEDLGEAWKPDVARFLIRNEPSRGRLSIDVDPEHPDAWRAATYYPTIKAWAAAVRAQGACVLVYAGPNTTVVFPEADIDIGPFGEEELVLGYRGKGPRRRPFVRLRRDGEVVREWTAPG